MEQVTMKVCPKCGYARSPDDTAPKYECPKCGIVYEKFLSASKAINEPKRNQVTPPVSSRSSLRSPPDVVDSSAAAKVDASGTHAPSGGTRNRAETSIGIAGLVILVLGVGLALMEGFARSGGFRTMSAIIVGAAIGIGIRLIVITGRLTAKRKYRESLQQFKSDPSNPDFREETIERGREYSNMTRNLFGARGFGEDALMNDINAILARASTTGAYQPKVDVLAAATSQADRRGTRSRVAIAYVLAISAILVFGYGFNYWLEARRIPNAIDLVKATLTERLQDPLSAQFKDVAVARIVNHQDKETIVVVCGKVNSKTPSGDYVGYHYFAVIDKIIFLDDGGTIDNVARTFCDR